ncbi:MAG: transposase [Bacteroidaceae bacterium]|nr:transposase [Bacteroidaceae bacterium]
MSYDPDIHHRRSVRLQEYDYSQDGFYFVTICVHDRLPLFGEIVDGEMLLNDAGRMVERWYAETECAFPNINCLEMIIMPNHFHCIWRIVGADLCVCPENGGDVLSGGHTGPPLHTVVQWFKTMTTNAYIRGVKQCGWPPFNIRLWQRNYYEHIIRNQRSYEEISCYILDNPMHWPDDQLYV